MLVIWHVLFAFGIIIFIFAEKIKSSLKQVITFLVVFSLAVNAALCWFSFEKTDDYDPQLSQKYLIEVNEACSKFDKPVKGATFCDANFYKNFQITYPLEYYCVPFILSPKVYVPYNLTYLGQVPLASRYQIEKSLVKSPFNQFLREQLAKPGITDTLQYQIEFITANQIKFLVCPKDPQTDFKLFLNVKTEITDALTGQRFIVLD